MKCTKKPQKHGMSSHPVYIAWRNMVNRCTKPKTKYYERYGGRGISVCEDWISDFISFKDWAFKNGWSKGLFLDRIDNDGDYSPENCRWITREESNRNRSNTKFSYLKACGVRKDFATGEYSRNALARKYNYSVGNITKVLKGEIWAKPTPKID